MLILLALAAEPAWLMLILPNPMGVGVSTMVPKPMGVGVSLTIVPKPMGVGVSSTTMPIAMGVIAFTAGELVEAI